MEEAVLFLSTLRHRAFAQPSQALWESAVLLLLSIIAFSLGLPGWIGWVLVAFSLAFLFAHLSGERSAPITNWLHGNIGLTAGWLRENLKLATVSALITVSGFLVLNYTNGLKQEIDLVRSASDAERSQNSEAIRNRDERIQNLLSATLNVPVLLSPQNARSRASVKHVVLQWASQLAYEHYLVEITRFDSFGKFTTKPIPATNPVQMSTLYPPGFTDSIGPGIYFWRVAAGDLDAGRASPQGSWSGYYRFDVFGSTIDRIHQNHRLTVGVTYNQNSDFMRRNEDGEPYGFDAELMGILSKKLGCDSDLNPNSSVWGQPLVIEYPSIDSLLRIGVLGGEVDLALSSVTKTLYRKNLGINFTQGYFDSHLVLLSRPSVGALAIRDAEVGAIEKTTNADAVKELCHARKCTPVPLKSFQDMLNALADGTVKFILVDEALSLQMIHHKQVRVVIHDVAKALPNYESLIGYPKEQYAIATPDEGLELKLTRILDDLQRDGTLQHLKEKYELAEGPPAKESY